jgi:hypothetical protein
MTAGKLTETKEERKKVTSPFFVNYGLTACKRYIYSSRWLAELIEIASFSWSHKKLMYLA